MPHCHFVDITQTVKYKAKLSSHFPPDCDPEYTSPLTQSCSWRHLMSFENASPSLYTRTHTDIRSHKPKCGVIKVKRNVAECFCLLSPGRDKPSHSYETVTQVEGKVLKNKLHFLYIKSSFCFGLAWMLLLSLFLSTHAKFIMRGPSSSWVLWRTG